MNTPPTDAPRVSKITVPQRAHPAAKLVFELLRRQAVSYFELEMRSGVLASTFKSWRVWNKPGLESLQAVLGALGWQFLPVPPASALPADLAERVEAIAVEWGDRDEVLARLIGEVANLPLATKDARLRHVTTVAA